MKKYMPYKLALEVSNKVGNAIVEEERQRKGETKIIPLAFWRAVEDASRKIGALRMTPGRAKQDQMDNNSNL